MLQAEAQRGGGACVHLRPSLTGAGAAQHAEWRHTNAQRFSKHCPHTIHALHGRENLPPGSPARVPLNNTRRVRFAQLWRPKPNSIVVRAASGSSRSRRVRRCDVGNALAGRRDLRSDHDLNFFKAISQARPYGCEFRGGTSSSFTQCGRRDFLRRRRAREPRQSSRAISGRDRTARRRLVKSC